MARGKGVKHSPLVQAQIESLTLEGLGVAQK